MHSLEEKALMDGIINNAKRMGKIARMKYTKDKRDQVRKYLIADMQTLHIKANDDDIRHIVINIIR